MGCQPSKRVYKEVAPRAPSLLTEDEAVISVQPSREMKGHKKPVRDVVATDTRVYTVSTDQTLRIWDVSNGECIERIDIDIEALTMVLNKDAHVLYIGGYDINMVVYDLKTGRMARVPHNHLSNNWLLELRLHRGYLFSSGQHSNVTQWDITDDPLRPQAVAEYVLDKASRNPRAPNALTCFAVETSHIVGGGYDFVQFWTMLESPRRIPDKWEMPEEVPAQRVLRPVKGHVQSLAICGVFLFIGTTHEGILQLNILSLDLVRIYSHNDSPVHSLKIWRESLYSAAIGDMRRYDPQSGECIEIFASPDKTTFLDMYFCEDSLKIYGASEAEEESASSVYEWAVSEAAMSVL